MMNSGANYSLADIAAATGSNSLFVCVLRLGK